MIRITGLSLHLGVFPEVLGHETLIPPPPLVTNQPYFDSTMKANITSHVGRNAELHCRVHNIGNRTATHLDGTNQWTLTIRSAQPRDEGQYDCQISTKPIKVFTTHLRVLIPKVEILGAPDLYVQRYSMINLTCVLYDVPEPPASILWFHGNETISYSSSRGGISLVVEKGPTTSSHLLIRNARLQDSGDYTCSPENMNSTRIRVHVLNGEQSAAMQTNGAQMAQVHLHFTIVTSVLVAVGAKTCSSLCASLLHMTHRTSSWLGRT
ncbi:Immunoglobulin-like domain [Trinorchestia longiramus]|nr:Immunoglobulin-like domain [Trinorchestia longiramus]